MCMKLPKVAERSRSDGQVRCERPIIFGTESTGIDAAFVAGNTRPSSSVEQTDVCENSPSVVVESYTVGHSRCARPRIFGTESTGIDAAFVAGSTRPASSVEQTDVCENSPSVVVESYTVGHSRCASPIKPGIESTGLVAIEAAGVRCGVAMYAEGDVNVNEAVREASPLVGIDPC